MDGYGKNSMHININKYTPLQGRSYINLPEVISDSIKQTINIHLNDKECFRWCIMRN